MPELIVDVITSWDGYAAADGWPGWWGLQGPEYLAWLDEQPERDYTILMGTNTYRLMSEFAGRSAASEADETAEDDAMTELTRSPKVMFSSTLDAPLSWANTQLVSGDAVEAVGAMKRDGTSMSTLGSLSLCRSLLEAGLVDRYRVVVFPVITGSAGRERIYDAHRPGAHLRRISRCRPRHGRQPNVRRPNPAPRVRPNGPHRSARLGWLRAPPE